MQDAPPIDRLTEREKECLRRWLERRTAKEIGLELGISHHAVEKRLKMARTKLGAHSSLDAARILAQAEAYGPAVTGSPDLRAEAKPRLSMRPRSIMTGGLVMSLTIVLAPFLVLSLAPSDERRPDANSFTAASTIRIDTNPEPIFALLDRDASGFLENPESPFVTALLATDTASGPGDASVPTDGADPKQIAEFYSVADSDGDGLISFREFHAWHNARLASSGVESMSTIAVRPVPES